MTDQEINQVEKQLNIKFPKDYLEIVSKNDGGYPFPFVFNSKVGEEAFNNLLSFKPDSYSNILKTLNDVSDRLIDGIIPFGEDPGGNLICFDYRSGNKLTIFFGIMR